MREGEPPPQTSTWRLQSRTLTESRFSLQQGFQQKFSFHSKEIVAISCSWCKQAVSLVQQRGETPRADRGTVTCCVSVFQYHNKVTCFMLQQIEECCSLGAHAAVIVPPTWIIRVRRPQVARRTLQKPSLNLYWSDLPTHFLQ